MMKRTGFILLALLIGLALLLLVMGCQPQQLSSQQEAFDLWGENPITLDPAISSESTSHAYIMQIFSGLVRLNEEMEVVPDIARSWEISQDGMTYTFYLRHGVKFHEGREVKAADFKYSWERACRPQLASQTAAMYLGDIIGAREMLAGEAESLSGVEVIDNYTLRVTIEAPRAYFLSKLTYPTAFVVNQDNVAAGSGWWYAPDGTGPFQLGEWQHGQQLILERNELYYGEKPLLDKVVFHLSGNARTMYERGQLDVLPVSIYYIDELRDKNSPLHDQLAVFPELSLHYIGFDTTAPPFDDVNVRRAFSHAVDKGAVINSTVKSMVQEAGGILPPGMPGYNSGLEPLEYNVTMARVCLANSRYGGADNLPPITLTTSGYGNTITASLGAIIQQWRENLGVEVQVRQVEPGNFLYHLSQEKDEMFILGWIADYPDPDNFLGALFHSGSENDIFGYNNSQLDALLDEAAVEQDEAVRIAMYRQAEQGVVEQAPCLPLWFGTNYLLVKPYVKDSQMNPLGIPNLSQVYLEH